MPAHYTVARTIRLAHNHRRRIARTLTEEGFPIDRKRVWRLMRRMGIEALGSSPSAPRQSSVVSSSCSAPVQSHSEQASSTKPVVLNSGATSRPPNWAVQRQPSPRMRSSVRVVEIDLSPSRFHPFARVFGTRQLALWKRSSRRIMLRAHSSRLQRMDGNSLIGSLAVEGRESSEDALQWSMHRGLPADVGWVTAKC